MSYEGRAGRWAGPSFAVVVLLSIYVLFAPTAGGPPPFAGSDKVVHLVLFALLAATARWRFGPSSRVVAALVAYAVLSEVVQGALISSRSADPYDVLADLLGVAAGWLAAGRLAPAR